MLCWTENGWKRVRNALVEVIVPIMARRNVKCVHRERTLASGRVKLCVIFVRSSVSLVTHSHHSSLIYHHKMRDILVLRTQILVTRTQVLQERTASF